MKQKTHMTNVLAFGFIVIIGLLAILGLLVMFAG